MEQNKVRTYFLYALGEILLVMIGILLALQVNNWNQDRLERLEESNSLKSLTKELSDNLEIFDRDYARHLNRKAAIMEFISDDILENELTYVDSISFVANYSWTYDPSLGIYNSIISSGKISIFQNEELRSSISSLGDLINDYQEEEQLIRDFSNDHLSIAIISEFIIIPEIAVGLRERTELEVRAHRKNYEDFLNKQEIRNMYSLLLFYIYDLENEGRAFRQEFVQLISDMETEIERLENK